MIVASVILLAACAKTQEEVATTTLSESQATPPLSLTFPVPDLHQPGQKVLINIEDAGIWIGPQGDHCGGIPIDPAKLEPLLKQYVREHASEFRIKQIDSNYRIKAFACLYPAQHIEVPPEVAEVPLIIPEPVLAPIVLGPYPPDCDERIRAGRMPLPTYCHPAEEELLRTMPNNEVVFVPVDLSLIRR